MAKGIYKRGQVYWIRYAGIDGRVVRESSVSTKFRDAEALLIQRRQAIKEGKQPEIIKIGNFYFNELADNYITWAERQRSVESKRQYIEALKEYFKNLPLRRFNTMLVEQFQSEKLQQIYYEKKDVKKNYQSSSINRWTATLKHMFTKAVEWHMVEEDVLKRVRRAKQLEENPGRLRYLTREESQTLINVCADHLKPIVICALNTGMRKSEILSLKWEQIDLKNGFILIEQTKNGQRREIPINNTLKVTLQGLTRRLDIPFVFYNPSTCKRYDDVKKAFHGACKKAKINDFVFHDLRHTFASQLVMAGADITTIKELLGHKSLTMTLRYAHLAPSHKTRAVELLDSIINADRQGIQSK